MDDLRKTAMYELLRGKTTNSLPDRLCHAEILKLCRASGDQDTLRYAQELILAMRKSWLLWRIDAQRKWQASGVNNFHDSFEIRERYIAPHVSCFEEYTYQKRAREYNRKRKPELFKRFKS